MAEKWKTGPYPKTCEYLDSIGIDPKAICEDGVTLNGYDTFALDDSGGRSIVDDRYARVRRSWPTPIVGGIVIALMQKDRARR